MSNISRCCDECEYVASVSVRCPLTKLAEGESIFAWAVVLPYEATDRRVTWSSSDNSIATINPDSGLITAQGVGKVVITATAVDREIVKGTYHLEVVPYVFVESVVIDTKVLVMQPCRTEKLNRTVSPANATKPHVCWNSSNECVATVDALGFVTANKEGETIITATSTDGTNLSATCRVVVVSDLDESITIPNEFPLWVRHQTESDCYKAGASIGTVKGIVVHSTGANNPTLKRYVDAPDLVGTNTNGNHWNQGGISKMVHAFIGLDKNNDIAIVNTLPYNYACWGVGSGKNGSYNYSPNGHIQFEICEDALADVNYFNEAVFGAAVEYCADLCKQFNLSVDSIISHKEAHSAGYGSNHGDPEHWLTRFGKTMNDFRNAVRNKLTS